MKIIIAVSIITLFLVPYFFRSFNYFKQAIDNRKNIILDKRQAAKNFLKEQKHPGLITNPEVNSNFQESMELPESLPVERSNVVVKNPVEENQVKQQEKSNIQEKSLSYPLKSKEHIIKIQSALKRSGFYKGKIDGKMGLRTKKAIKAFQKLRGLRPDGIVGKKTWEALESI